MIPEDQVQQIKSQIIQQIESTFPPEKKAAAVEQIESLNSEELEEFLAKNNMIRSQTQGEGGQQCIFCLISEGKVPSNQIDETKTAVAALEINPISKGHVIVIPKKHSKKLVKGNFSLAEKIAEKIKKKFKPKNVIISEAELFGHRIINILPVYNNETPKSERTQASPEDLKEIQEALIKKPKTETIKKTKPKLIDEKTLWLPKRIP